MHRGLSFFCLITLMLLSPPAAFGDDERLAAGNTVGRIASIDPTGRIQQLTISKSEWDSFTSMEYYGRMDIDEDGIEPGVMGMRCAPCWTSAVYEAVRDEYDFILFILNTGEKPEAMPMNGYYQCVRNDIRGIGTPYFGKSLFDFSKYYAASTRLQGIVFLTRNDVLFEGPLLHELMHRWGNYILYTESYTAHWGDSSVGGILGGFKSFQQVGEHEFLMENYNRFWNAPYAPLELYLMGLIPPEEVPDIYVIEDMMPMDAEYKLPRNRLRDIDSFRVSGKHRVFTINQIIQGQASNPNQRKGTGPRLPDYKCSQKSFNILPVLVDYDTPRLEEVRSVIDQLDRFCCPGYLDDGVYNFYEATGGRAVMQYTIPGE